MYLHANTDFDATALPARNQDSCSSSSPSLNYYIYFFSRYIMYIIYINYIIKPTYIQSTHIRGGKKKTQTGCKHYRIKHAGNSPMKQI